MTPTAALDWLKANKAQASAWVAAVTGWATALSGPGAGDWVAANAEWVVPSVLLLVSGIGNVIQAVRTGSPLPDLPPAPGPEIPDPTAVPDVSPAYPTAAGVVTVTSETKEVPGA